MSFHIIFMSLPVLQSPYFCDHLLWIPTSNFAQEESVDDHLQEPFLSMIIFKNLSCRWSSSRILPVDDQYVRRKSSKEEIKKMWCGWLGTTLWFTRKPPFFKIPNCSHFDRYIPSFLLKYFQDFVGLECRRIEPESLLKNESEMNLCEWWCVLSVGVQKICWNDSKVLWTQLVVSQSPDQSIQRLYQVTTFRNE